MDHDSKPINVARPASHRISDLSETYEQIIRDGLMIMYHEILANEAYQTNDSGHFAWDIAPAIRAACIAWRITGDSSYLRHATVWAQHIVERTDSNAGRSDWRGQNRPVWSSGSRYTAGEVALRIAGCSGVTLQAAAERVVIERPTDSTAIIHAMDANGRAWSSPEASLIPDDSDYLPDVLARRSGVHSVLLRGLESPLPLTGLPAGDYRVRPQRAAHLVHTGAISRSLIAVADTLRASGNEAAKSEVSPDELYQAARSALLSHEDEVCSRRGLPWYITPLDFPGRRLGLELPHNHVAEVSTSFILLGLRNREQWMYSRGRSLSSRFLNEIELSRNGSIPHPWFYYPIDSDMYSGIERHRPLSERIVMGVPRAEDSSHATGRVRALVDWKLALGDAFPAGVLEAVAASFIKDYFTKRGGVPSVRWLPGDAKESPRVGFADTYPGAWGALSAWSPQIKRTVNSLAYRHPPGRIFGATILSAAEILAMNTRLFPYIPILEVESPEGP